MSIQHLTPLYKPFHLWMASSQAEQRADDIGSLDEVVTDEKAVADFYHQTTAKYCSRVASTLALHPTASFSRWRSLLSWTQSGPSSGYAIMDGLLCFIREGVDQNKILRAAIVESMESKNRLIFEEMRKSMSPLATWEMKSTSAGRVEVMTAVFNLGKFSWTTCTAPDCFTNPKHEKAREKVGRVLVGPDVQAPPWSFPDDSSNTFLVPENRDDEIDLQPLPPHIDPTIQWPVTRRVTRSATGSASSTLPPPPPSASRSSKHGSATKDKGKKRKRDDDDCDDGAYQDRHDTTAQSLVQQAWAQAVRADGTVIVLHSGNHELVCLRHRGSQTFYVSDIIEPPTCVDPGYGKLHVGIYIAAIQDTMDRRQQLPSPIPQPKAPGDGVDLIGGDKDQDDQDDNWGSGSGRKDDHGHRQGRRRGGHGVRRSGGFQGLAGRKGPTDDELVAIEKMIHVANNRDVAHLYLQYNVYDSPIPASFLRSAPSIMAHTRCPTPFSPRAIRTYRLEECLTIVLTSEIGRGATGVVHRGTLKPEIWDDAMPLDVVVKLAFDIEQRDVLRSEYEVYHCLRPKGVHQGIATVLGFFDDSEGGARALVMLYAGVPLCTESRGNLSISDRKSTLSTLKSIHCAGILHRDICWENILIGDLGVTIIDFGHSEQCDDQGVKDEEFARLRYFLGLAGESH